MDWHLILGGVAGVLAVGAIVPYVKDILHGTTRPNVVSWILWVLLLSISVLAQLSAGASESLIFMIGDLVGTSIILILCLVGYGYGTYGWIEIVCFCLALLAIVLWQLTQQPLLAIVFSIVADFMASVPTVVKAYRDPQSEAPLQFFIIAFASILALSSNTLFDVANIAFPAYLLIDNGLIGGLAFFGRRLKKAKQ